MQRRNFYDYVRQHLFPGHLIQSQVDGMEALLDAGEAQSVDPRWIAYVLATTLHETDATMQPIREYGLGRGKPYGTPDPVTHQTYYGRGYVQLTHKVNYQTMSDKLGVDMVNNPDVALKPDIAAKIIYLGMTQGFFTTHKLADYFNATTSDWYNARRIVNGLDLAMKIAGYGTDFYTAILRADAPDAQPVAAAQPVLAPNAHLTLDIAALRQQIPVREPDYIQLEKQSLLAG
jgi:putative chitinase